MSTPNETQSTAAEPKSSAEILTKTVFDLKTFEDVKIGIEFIPSPAFTSLAEALSFYGNDEAKVLRALNEDKAEKERKATLAKPISEFHTFADDEETTLNGPADVQVANDKMVNDLVLNLAKQHYGFSKDSTRDQKAAAKVKARDFIKANEGLRLALATMSAATMGS